MPKKNIEKGDPSSSEDEVVNNDIITKEEIPQTLPPEDIPEEKPKVRLNAKGLPDGRVGKPRTEKQLEAFRKMREKRTKLNEEKKVIRQSKINKKKEAQKKHAEDFEEAMDQPPILRRSPQVKPLPREPNSSVVNNYYYYGDRPDNNKDNKKIKSVEKELSPKANNIPHQPTFQLHFG
tara:strand:+ start:2322 stop:2855 length:534 start_codon:yes stop_codon:yes gene_type:complete